jgi:cation transport ATPase
VTVATLASLVLRENVPALVVIWLLNLGEYLRFFTLRRSRQAIEELLSLGEDEVFVVVDGTGEHDVLVTEALDHEVEAFQLEDKYALLRQLGDEGARVAMVGDGISPWPPMTCAAWWTC